MIIKPPTSIKGIDPFDKVVFLAGSIEQGAAEDWQPIVAKTIDDANSEVVVLNPRRDEWDPTWVQDIENPNFNLQVNWEMDGIDMSDAVFFYFDPNTKAPITLAELGICYGKGIRSFVVCPPGYWRRGNVQIICERAGFHLFDKMDDGVNAIMRYLR